MQDGDRFAAMDEYIRAALGKWQVPGLAVAVIKDGKIVVARGYGVCEIGKDRKVTQDSIFPIASCTKSFTATCIAMLADEGKLNWDDPVRKHLPNFKVADAYVTEHVTIRDLLCHRTGLVRGDLLGITGSFTPSEILNRLQFLPRCDPFSMPSENRKYGKDSSGMADLYSLARKHQPFCRGRRLLLGRAESRR